MKLFNKYALFARIFPAMITAFPLLFVYFYFVQHYNQYDISSYVSSIQFIAGIPISMVAIYLISMVVRELGLNLEKRYFHQKLGFPSTYFMLYSNEKYPEQSKQLIRRYVLEKFGLGLPTRDDEIKNISEALKTLSEMSRLLSTKYQQNLQLKDMNIAYGFFRNVSGGIIISIIFSIIVLGISIYTKNILLISFSGTVLVLYGVIYMFRKQLIVRSAEKYAEKLFAIFLLETPANS